MCKQHVWRNLIAAWIYHCRPIRAEEKINKWKAERKWQAERLRDYFSVRNELPTTAPCWTNDPIQSAAELGQNKVLLHIPVSFIERSLVRKFAAAIYDPLPYHPPAPTSKWSTIPVLVFDQENTLIIMFNLNEIRTHNSLKRMLILIRQYKTCANIQGKKTTFSNNRQIID